MLCFDLFCYVVFSSNFDTPPLFRVSRKQLETGGFERAGAGDCRSLETGIILSCWALQKMPRMIRFGRRWTQRNQIGSWRRTDWLLRCGIGRTSLLDSCEYLENSSDLSKSF